MFSDDYDHLTPDEMRATLAANVRSANIPCMVVTMGEQGAVYARTDGESGMVPAKKVDVIDTTGAGDAFFAGTVIGLTYGKPPGRVGHLHLGECLPAVPPAGVRAGCAGHRLIFFRFLAHISLILPFFRFRTFCLFSSFISAHFRLAWPFQCISVSEFFAQFFGNSKYLVTV